nr:MAG TPA: DNA fragmentation factor alpha subunit [Caudoviricetes sp.]
MDLYERNIKHQMEKDKVRQENLRLRSELDYAMRVLSALKYKGISSITISNDDLRNVSENPPNIDIHNYIMNDGENIIEW